jgi:hypothetical protein
MLGGRDPLDAREESIYESLERRPHRASYASSSWMRR